jgi:hypothetical protein
MEPFFIVKRVTISGNDQWIAASGRRIPRESANNIRILPIEQAMPPNTRSTRAKPARFDLSHVKNGHRFLNGINAQETSSSLLKKTLPE